MFGAFGKRSNGEATELAWNRNHTVYLGFDPVAIVEDCHMLANQQRVWKDVEAIAVLIGCAGNLHCGNIPAEGTARSEGLRRGLLTTRIQNEARGCEVDKFVASR